MSGAIFVGVSGFSYDKWKGRFYPKETAAQDFLSYYSQRLNSVEINSSFYTMPSLSSVKSWEGNTVEKFKFSFKAPRRITHISKLAEEAVKPTLDLSKILEGLGSKRGPVLFQLPPFSTQDLNLLENFLVKTTAVPDRVLEFRHRSWLVDSTFALLEKYDSGFCVAETEDLEPVLKVTGGLAYFRLRRDVYEPETIKEWAGKIKKTIKDANQAFVYLRHDETGENAELAQKLQAWI